MARRPTPPDYAVIFAATMQRICDEQFDGNYARFAACSDMSPKNAERWCKGRAVPKVHDAARAARALGMSLDELVGRREPSRAIAAAAEAVPERLAAVESLLQALLDRLDEAKIAFTAEPSAPEDGPVHRVPAPASSPKSAARRSVQRGTRAARRSTRPHPGAEE